MTRKILSTFVATSMFAAGATIPVVPAMAMDEAPVESAATTLAAIDNEDGYEGETAGPRPEPEIDPSEFSGARLNKVRGMKVDPSLAEIKADLSQADTQTKTDDPTWAAEALYRPARGRIAFTFAPQTMNEVAQWSGQKLESKSQLLGIGADAALTKASEARVFRI
jgi:hypothetical protein